MFSWLNKKNEIKEDRKLEMVQDVISRLTLKYPSIRGDLKVVQDYWKHNMTEREHAMTEAKIQNSFQHRKMEVQMVSHFLLSEFEKKKITSSTIAELIERRINPLRITVSFLYGDKGEMEGKRLSYDLNIKELLELSKIDAFYATKVLATISYIAYLIVMKVATNEFHT
ncbi:hypothetical protein [Aquitalea pelogenes]|uniref:hypothetical protein n=1 Tax=Aquitalea pelogenes TaxID=1293573 RepID=UPI0035B4CF4F